MDELRSVFVWRGLTSGRSYGRSGLRVAATSKRTARDRGQSETCRNRRLNHAQAPAEPAGESAEQEAKGTEQRGTRDGVRSGIGGLCRLLLRLLHSLPILLLIALDLGAGLLDRHVLSPP